MHREGVRRPQGDAHGSAYWEHRPQFEGQISELFGASILAAKIHLAQKLKSIDCLHSQPI